MDAAKAAHTGLGFFGVVRYDFFLKDSRAARRRWSSTRRTPCRARSPSTCSSRPALPFPELADTLLDIAFAEAAERRATTRTFESVLIAEHQRR